MTQEIYENLSSNLLKETYDRLNEDPLNIEMFEEIKENAKDYKYPLATKTICNFIIERIRNDDNQKI